jgi:hypothetical protein
MIAHVRLAELAIENRSQHDDVSGLQRTSPDLVCRSIPIVFAVYLLPALLAVLVVGALGLLGLAIASLFSGTSGGSGGWHVRDDLRPVAFRGSYLLTRRARALAGSI